MKVTETPPWIRILQYVSIAWMWVFVIGISTWIIHLIRLSTRLNDVPSATIAISVVAIPIFLTGASVLTYVFRGLQTADDDPLPAGEEREESQS